ncbi:MAG: hypothetical protein IJF84_00235 [Thermoguttaceae bacterium]|nr:hypothetical protein [Thermoguttaceae bacterium]
MGNSFFNTKDTYTFKSGVNGNCLELKIWQGNGTGTDGSSVKFDGLIAQSVTAGVRRQPQIIYEVGSNNYYVIDSKPAGTGQIRNILGPATSTLSALKKLGDICQPTNIQFKMKNCTCTPDGSKSSNSGSKESYTFVGGFLTGVTLAAQSDSFAVAGQWDFLFQDLQTSN